MLKYTVALAGLLISSMSAESAVVNSLTADWSNTGLPMAGVWDLRVAGSSLPAVAAIVGVDTYPVTQPAYQSTDNFPVWFKSEFDGSAFTNPNNIDWLTGDVIVHTDTGGLTTSAVWTSNFDGKIDITGGLWNPRDFARSQAFSLTINGSEIMSGSVTDSSDSGNPVWFGDSGLMVGIGDEVALNLTPILQDYVGVTFEISQVPLPAAAWLFGSALLGLGALKRKKA